MRYALSQTEWKIIKLAGIPLWLRVYESTS